MMNQVDELVVMLRQYARVSAADRCVNSAGEAGLQAIKLLRAALPKPEKLEEIGSMFVPTGDPIQDPIKAAMKADLFAMAKKIRSVY